MIFQTSELGERQGHRVTETVKHINLVTASQDNLDGMSVFLKLKEGLATNATRSCRLLDKVALGKRSNGHRFHGHTRKLGTGSIESRTLATDAGKCRILLISPNKYFPIIEQQSRPDFELTIGRIGACRGLASHVNQFFLLFGELIIRINSYLCGDFIFGHRRIL